MPLEPDPYNRNIHIKFEIDNALGPSAWYALKKATDAAVWKKHFEKMLRSYLVAAKATVTVADDCWHQEFQANIMTAIKGVRSAGGFDSALDVFCAALIRQSYLQLGMVLNRRGSARESFPLVSGNWRLNAYRTVQYVQTREQRDRRFKVRLQTEIGVEAQHQALRDYERSKSDLSFENWYSASRQADDGAADSEAEMPSDR